jgi:drug/metabolite transporter, DME family
MSSSRASVPLVLAAGMLFGTAGTAQALGPMGTTPLGVGILRIGVGALALLVAMPFLGESPRTLVALWRTRAMLVTAVTAAVYQLCFFAGVSRAGVALGTLVAVGSAPVFAGLVGRVVLGHRPTVGWAVATAVCVAGLALLSGQSLVSELGAGPGGAVLGGTSHAGEALGGTGLGLLLALGAGLCIACYNVAAKIQLDRGATPLAVPAGSFVLGGALLIPVLAVQPLGWLPTVPGLALALYLGVATMAVANVLLTRGIKGMSAGPVATLMLSDPVVATVLGVAILGEALSAPEVGGIVLLLAGLVLQAVIVAREDPDEPESVPVL